MKSDFAAARVHLDRAYHYLQGGDRVSQEGRIVLIELLETITSAECRQPGTVPELVRFPISRRVRQPR